MSSKSNLAISIFSFLFFLASVVLEYIFYRDIKQSSLLLFDYLLYSLLFLTAGGIALFSLYSGISSIIRKSCSFHKAEKCIFYLWALLIVVISLFSTFVCITDRKVLKFILPNIVQNISIIIFFSRVSKGVFGEEEIEHHNNNKQEAMLNE